MRYELWVFKRISEWAELGDRMCCICNGSVMKDGMLWKVESGWLYVCSGCYAENWKDLMSVKVGITQREENN